MAWKKGEKIPTNLIVGFLGSGKTTAITKLIRKRPEGQNWSILINEFGTVSIDHALVDSGDKGVAVEELGGGCACCTLAFAFKPLLAKFIRRTKPDRLILEPSGVSHPAKVVDILRSSDFAGAINLRNIICLIDPKDFDDPRWRETEVFQDQVQLADIVVLNWTDERDRELIDRCRKWVQEFRPPKQLILETSFGEIDSELLDREFDTVRFPLFSDAHPLPDSTPGSTPDADDGTNSESKRATELKLVPQDSHQHDHTHEHDEAAADKATSSEPKSADPKPSPRKPLRFQNESPDYDACGWIFHVDDVFNRDKLLDLLGYVHPIVRLKGVFHCDQDWWTINRAKDGTSYAPSAYRRDSRLEIILDRTTSGWDEFEAKLLECLAD